MVESALGGVLFVDEAYSLVQGETNVSVADDTEPCQGGVMSRVLCLLSEQRRYPHVWSPHGNIMFLPGDGRDSFGHEALDTLIKLTEDNRGNLVVRRHGCICPKFVRPIIFRRAYTSRSWEIFEICEAISISLLR